MIKEHLQFSLYERGVFERVVLQPPMKAPDIMHNEACFLYAIAGESRVYSAVSEMTLHTEEAVVMKCGNYLNDWLLTSDVETCQTIAIHFYPDVIKKLYDKELPDFFKSVQNFQPTSLEKVKSSKLLSNYINSL